VNWEQGDKPGQKVEEQLVGKPVPAKSRLILPVATAETAHTE
jgi:hypothetical protein